MTGQTLWQFLGIEETCNLEELKAAWRKKVKLLHPDVNGGDARKTEIFIEAKAIYEKALKWKEEQAARPMANKLSPDEVAPNLEQNTYFDALRRAAQAQQQAQQYQGSTSQFWHKWMRR